MGLERVPVLRIAGRSATAPAPPSAGAPGVSTWWNRHGGVVAVGYTFGGAYWMYWPRLATYRAAPDDEVITAYPVPGAPFDVIHDTYQRSVLPMALQALGYEALHASGVSLPLGVVGLFAGSETGKSTIAYALAGRGFPLWSDDSVLIEPESQPFRSAQLPFEIRLRPASREYFAAQPMPPNTCDGKNDAARIATAPIAALVLLSRVEGAAEPVRAARLDPVRAFSSLLTHAHCFNPFDEPRRARMLRHYLEIAATLPVFELVFRPSLDDLPLVIDGLVEALEPVALVRPAAAARA